MSREDYIELRKSISPKRIEELFGPRCPDVDINCPCCFVWALWDESIPGVGITKTEEKGD